jgi:FkbM family methyltransferase
MIESQLKHIFVQDRKIYFRDGTHDTTIINENLNPNNPKPEYLFPNIKDAKVVFDVGGNIGITALVMAMRYPDAVVYTFEPELQNFQIMKKNIQGIDNIKAFNFGLFSKTCEMKLKLPYCADNPAAFSLFDLTTTKKEEVIVDIRSVSEFIQSEHISRIDAIKIDCEGAEYDILTSIPEQILKNTVWVEGECHGIKDFELMQYLEKTYDIGFRDKPVRAPVWKFHALNKNAKNSEDNFLFLSNN